MSFSGYQPYRDKYFDELPTPLKWAGGKRWLVPQLRLIWQQHIHRRLVEPFCGGLSVALGLNPDAALLNDINPHVINFYQQLQQGLESSATSDEFNEDTYYHRRELFNEYIKRGDIRNPDTALLFYYLNRSCFNGLTRFNSKGLYNVPMGSYKKVNYMNTEDFARYISVLSRWQFTAGDFSNMLIQDNDFIYCDPPYDVNFTKYAKQDFTWDDQVRLIEWLSDCDNPILISNQATERIVALYQEAGYTIKYLKGRRMINSTGDRTPADEVLAARNIELPDDAIKQPRQPRLF